MACRIAGMSPGLFRSHCRRGFSECDEHCNSLIKMRQLAAFSACGKSLRIDAQGRGTLLNNIAMISSENINYTNSN